MRPLVLVLVIVAFVNSLVLAALCLSHCTTHGAVQADLLPYRP